MSTQTAAAPTIEELPVNDHALTQTGAAMTVDAKIQAAKAKAKAAREAAEKADEEAKHFSKNRRDEVRRNDRRALLVGRAMLARSVADRSVWGDLWPDLVASLSGASDEDRALVGLLPWPKIDTRKSDETAASVLGKVEKTEADKPENKDRVEVTDEQSAEPEHPSDPRADS